MTYLTKNLEFFSNLDGMQAICAEKCLWKNSPSQALPRQLPRRGSQAVKLIAKVICVMGKLLAQVQSLRARQRLPPRGSWQNRQVLTEGVQAAAVCLYDLSREKRVSEKSADFSETPNLK